MQICLFLLLLLILILWHFVLLIYLFATVKKKLSFKFTVVTYFIYAMSFFRKTI